jgi:hypothetical protein
MTGTDEANEGDLLRVAALIGSRVPASAEPLLRDGVAALTWDAAGGWRSLHSVGGAPMRLASERAGPGPRSAEAFLAMSGDPASCSPAAALLRMASPGHGAGDPLGGPVRKAVLVALAGTLDARAWIAMETYGLCADEVLEWLSSGDGGRLALARSHPWLAGALASARHPCDAAIGEDVGTALPAALRGILGRRPTPDEAQAALRMRGFAYPQGSIGDVGPEQLRALASVPADLFPPELPEGSTVRDPRQQAHLAFLSIAPPVAILSHIGGRAFRSISGRPEDWGDYVADLAAQAGLADTPDDFPEDWGAILANDAMHEVFDMARAFAAEVLSPALILAGRDPWSGPVADGRCGRTMGVAEGDPVMRASLRLLLGERTLRRLAETCGRWQARADGIAREVAALAGETAPRGPRLFPDLDLGDGHYLTSLHTLTDLLAEGAPGPDANGALGLCHCVGGYGREVASARTAIVSLRRRVPGGYERISTAEVAFQTGPGAASVLQHRGRRNARPAANAASLMAFAIAAVTDEARANLAAFVPGPEGWGRTDALVAGADAWTRMRDLWAFALPRPLRGLPASGILSAAGLDEPSDGYVPALGS